MLTVLILKAVLLLRPAIPKEIKIFLEMFIQNLSFFIEENFFLS